VSALAGLTLLAHLATNLFSPYGFHRDEFLYMAMGRHLRLWQMDFPPLIAILANAERALFGDARWSLRLAPAIVAALLVLLAGRIARALGGGRSAQGVAALAVTFSPLFLRSATLFQPVIFDQLWWTLALLALVELCRAGIEPRPDDVPDPRRSWLALGVALGLGLLTKFSIAFIGIAVALAIAVTPLRRWLRTPWPYAAALLALALGAPSLVGQLRLGWPVAQQMAKLRDAQLARVGPAEFLLGQLLAGPAALLAAAGLGWLLVAREARPFRAVGVSAAAAFLLLLALHGKPYYAGPLYPTLIAAGAVLLQRLAERGRGGRRLRSATEIGTVVFGVVTIGMSLPILPPRTMVRYAATLGIRSAVTTNRGNVMRLPQDYADMLNWEEQVKEVAKVYQALPPADRARAVVFVSNYGEAGAVDFYGPRLGLPNAICRLGTYWFFGPGRLPGDVAVTVGFRGTELRRWYGDIRPQMLIVNPDAVAEEQAVGIAVARQPFQSMQSLWASFAGEN
jgi:hypothetical protein